MIEFLNNYSPLVTAVFTGVLFIATGVLCVVTFWLYQATKKMAEASSQPFIVATFELNQWSFKHCDLVISNTGNASAFDIKIKIIPDTRNDIVTGEQSTKPIPMNNISVLPPGKEMRSGFSEIHEVMGVENTRSIIITWKRNPELKEPDLLAYDYYFPSGIIPVGGGSPEVKIANQLQKIQEHLVRKDCTGRP